MHHSTISNKRRNKLHDQHRGILVRPRPHIVINNDYNGNYVAKCDRIQNYTYNYTILLCKILSMYTQVWKETFKSFIK